MMSLKVVRRLVKSRTSLMRFKLLRRCSQRAEAKAGWYYEPDFPTVHPQITIDHGVVIDRCIP
jgi:hypothetical protein